MKKVTLLSIVVFAAIVLLLDCSEGNGDLDFFEILDKTTAEYLLGESTENKQLHRSTGSSAAAVSAPRNNRFLEASMQIIRGMRYFTVLISKEQKLEFIAQFEIANLDRSTEAKSHQRFDRTEEEYHDLRDFLYSIS